MIYKIVAIAIIVIVPQLVAQLTAYLVRRMERRRYLRLLEVES